MIDRVMAGLVIAMLLLLWLTCWPLLVAWLLVCNAVTNREALQAIAVNWLDEGLDSC